MSDRTIWIVGEHVKTFGLAGTAWELIGVVETEADAIAACKKPEHFIAPLLVGACEYDPRSEWPGAIYPLRQD